MLTIILSGLLFFSQYYLIVFQGSRKPDVESADTWMAKPITDLQYLKEVQLYNLFIFCI